MNNPKVCVLCKHFYFSPGEPGYSEYTPGTDMSLGCNLFVWTVNDCSTQQEVRDGMLKAETCPDFDAEAK